MGKAKVVNTNLDQNLNGTNFNNVTSETIFSFGGFKVTSNFDGRIPIDYTNTLSSFVRPVTLETLGVNDAQSTVLYDYTVNATLNLDKSNLNTYVKFGSTYEFFRVAIQNILINYPASLFANSNTLPGGNATFSNYVYDSTANTSTFKVPSYCIKNTFGLIYNQGNSGYTDSILRNVNLSYEKYSVWSQYNPEYSYFVIGFTGDTLNAPSPHITVKVIGDPFPFNSGATTGKFNFHIKPNNVVFEEFRALLTNYEQYIVSQREGVRGFRFNLNDPTLLDDGSVTYANTAMIWTTTDGYNVDINNSQYDTFLNSVLTIGAKYDYVKTNLIARFLTPTSLKTYDTTEDGKMSKLLKVYGWEFDQVKKFIDSLTFINTVTYNKLNNIPDQLVSNLARTFGWDYFNLVNEAELVNSFFTIESAERNLNTDLLPAEINIELWRRILMNTNYFWKSKGTRNAIKSIFLLIGIPEPFINITEYVYTVAGKINPNTVELTAEDFPNNSLPYDNSGYPKAPIESNSFYFQISGDTDSGQAYMNNFRNAGFKLQRTPDNKKSWIQTGATTRVHYTTPQYYQEDSQLVLNTKEVGVSLDTARGIEYDVYDYILKDFAANSTGYTMPFSYVNLSLGVSAMQNTFTLPMPYDKTQGNLEVRYNGILLSAPTEFSGATGNATYTDLSKADYSATTNSFTILNGNYAYNNPNRRDVIQATFVYSGATTLPVSGVTIEYVVTRIRANLAGTIIPLPSMPRGDVQVTINGIALTKGTPQFVADYIVNPNNTSGSSSIIIQNPDVIAYLSTNPIIQVAYVEVTGTNGINARSEVVRVDSFNTGKIYYNNSANKYVFTLNYKMNKVSDVKILVNGIALEPGMDYTLNTQNPYEIFLPKGLTFGSIISAYYIVGSLAVFTPIIDDNLGVGDISKLSFLEFIEMIQRRMINARTRKTISDFKGGWYPSLLSVYIKYLQRGLLPENDPMHSNAYTFANLYPFLSKYNSFFQRFVDELLSATIILEQSGLLVRNTVFTKQKFMYKRGVNVPGNGRIALQYLGDDGSQFLIAQPSAVQLHVHTTTGTTGIGRINNTGGNSISGYTSLTQYGMQYKVSTASSWSTQYKTGFLPANSFTMSLTGLSENTNYNYRAYVKSNIYSATGNTLTLKTSVTPGPLVTTKTGTTSVNSINNTGGINIGSYAVVTSYAMEYRISGGTWQMSPSVPITTALTGNNFTLTINGLNAYTYYEYRAYVVIGGLPYRGATLLIRTAAGVLSVPTVSGGTATAVTSTGFTVQSKVTSIGSAPITEYGILYTQVVSLGTAANLIYGNVPTVTKNSTIGSIGIGVNFPNYASNLFPNAATYYRTFAKNSIGVGYGPVKIQQTLP